MLKKNPDPRIRVFAVWEPILPTDYSSPSARVLARLSDPRVAQYWDKNHLFAEQLARRLKSDPDHPRPRCCDEGGIDWDEVAVYRKDTRWDDQLPRAVFLDGPVVHALGFANVVAELLSKATDTEPKSENSQAMRSLAVSLGFVSERRRDFERRNCCSFTYLAFAECC